MWSLKPVCRIGAVATELENRPSGTLPIFDDEIPAFVFEPIVTYSLPRSSKASLFTFVVAYQQPCDDRVVVVHADCSVRFQSLFEHGDLAVSLGFRAAHSEALLRQQRRKRRVQAHGTGARAGLRGVERQIEDGAPRVLLRGTSIGDDGAVCLSDEDCAPLETKVVPVVRAKGDAGGGFELPWFCGVRLRRHGECIEAHRLRVADAVRDVVRQDFDIHVCAKCTSFRGYYHTPRAG